VCHSCCAPRKSSGYRDGKTSRRSQ
jgi:hypothetical protein